MTVLQSKSRRSATQMFKASLLATAAMLGACATTPEAYTPTKLAPVVDELMQPDPVPAGFGDTPLSLEAARAMTVSRNLDYRQRVRRLMQQLDQETQASLLPQVYANSFGRWRNNTNASVGVRVSERNGEMPEDFFTAQDRSFATSNLTLTWNVLDIALSRLDAANGAIRGYDAIESNRAGCHQLMVDLERAYWRKAAYDRAKDRRDWLNNRIDYGLQISEASALENPDSQLDEWMFQRELIDIKRWYESMYRGLASAEMDLKRLINVPQNTELTIAGLNNPDDGALDLAALRQSDPQSLFRTALEHRPEVRRALYTQDRMEQDNRKAMLRHLPGVGLFVSGNNDTNSFALNNDYLSAGVNLSWNLIGLAKIGEVRRHGQNRLATEREQLSVVATTVTAQVALALEEMGNLEEEVRLAWKAKGVQSEITARLDRDAQAGTSKETYLIKEELLRELSVLREDIARAELRAGEARLAQSLGIMQACVAPPSVEVSAGERMTIATNQTDWQIVVPATG